MTRRYRHRTVGRALTLPALLLAIVLFFALPALTERTQRALLAGRCERAALQIHVIDVGQGDALLLRCAAGDVLIDTGTNRSEEALRTYLELWEVETLDYLIISHPHEDHIGGADMVLREYDVEHLVMSDLAPDADVGEAFGAAVVRSEAEVLIPEVGDVLELGELTITLLSPPPQGFETVNDNSLVLHCRVGEVSLLLMGDAEAGVEQWLLDNTDPALLDCELLKAGHHGSDTSSTDAFLAAVSPLFVTVSCARDNTYNHPAQAVLDAVAAVGGETCRTDTDGSLLFLSDGETLWREQ